MEDGRVEPLIVVLQFFSPNRWKGKTSVQSHFQFSKLHIDPTLSDVKEFRTRLIGDTPSGSVRIAQVSSQGGSSGIVELQRGTAIVKTIEQVMAIEEEGQVWIVGRIMSINAGENDWCYQACTGCDKKVEKGNNGKYKVEVVASDGTRGVSLLLWDTQANLLCGKSVEQIKMEGGLRDEEYPETLDSMMWRLLLFRIYVKKGHVKGSDNIYSVAAMCDDEDIVTLNFLDDFKDNGCSNEVNEDSGEVSLEQTNDASVVVTMMDDFVTIINMKTPGKRSAASVKHCASKHPEQEVNGQHLTNRFSRKGLKRGKM
ncbi:hypothetical protein PIB30_073876 [Stylosanthes scabra]|uniref:Uncharacterized protein n=1 Tax=Stylosanthes scabra TaxID=79078 RepID=A0ABU6VS22_9FABA|nr:hypothetical protein [Stylosanthes scabra]